MKPGGVVPVVLEGHGIRLEPLTEAHGDALAAAASDGRLWEFWYIAVPPPEGMKEYVTDALKGQRDGHMLPWAVRDLPTGAIVGSTRYHDIAPAIDRVEIGHTWYAKRAQRTAINTECKLMLLAHAFEKLACIAVEFRTHWFNHASREAIARLGAKQDAVLRNHQLMPDGSKRDTVVFSIIDGEWPAVKRHLKFQLERPR